MIDNEVLKNMRQRFSCRRFKDQAVEKEKIEAIIDAAKYAASGHTEQPWHFTLVTSDEGKQMLLDAVAPEPEDFKRLAPPGASWPFPNDFFGAPVVIMISGKTDVPWPLAGPYLAAGNIMNAAQSLGLSATWLTVFSNDVFRTDDTMANRSKFVPEGYEIRGTLVLGYPNAVPPVRPPRREDVETWI